MVVVAFSLLFFFCLQVVADQFCFMLPLPSPFHLSLSYVLFFFVDDAKTKIPIASS
jgi:hypothetical protein